MTVTGKGPLHREPESHVLNTAEPVSTETAFPTSDFGTGNWGGLRDEWKEKGFEFVPTYTAEPAANISGGEKNGTTYIHNIDLDFSSVFEGTSTIDGLGQDLLEEIIHIANGKKTRAEVHGFGFTETVMKSTCDYV